MKRCASLLVLCCVVAGCTSGKPASANGVRAEQIVGKWRVVQVDGRPPAEMHVKSLDLEIRADGKWTSKVEITDLDGMELKGGGTWSLADGGVRYTNGEKEDISRVSLHDGRLVLDPDFHLRKNDATKAPLNCEYER